MCQLDCQYEHSAMLQLQLTVRAYKYNMKFSNNYCATTKQTQMESNSQMQYHLEVLIPKVYLHVKKTHSW